MADDSALNIAMYLLVGALLWFWLVSILRGHGDEH